MFFRYQSESWSNWLPHITYEFTTREPLDMDDKSKPSMKSLGKAQVVREEIAECSELKEEEVN